jgi:hypothetical protein
VAHSLGFQAQVGSSKLRGFNRSPLGENQMVKVSRS